MARIALIQLISEQTMQNLLPVLRLKPAVLIHLATPKTADRSAFIAEAARQSGLKPRIELVRLSAMPAMPETLSAVKLAILQSNQTGHTPVVNFTGGTKLMSIGAFAAALHEKHNAISLYVDTEDETFVDGRTKDGLATLLDDDFSFTPLRQALTVNMVAVANGKQRVTGGRDWRRFLPLAEHLFSHPEEEQGSHEAMFGPNGLCPLGREPRKPIDWIRLIDRKLELPPTVVELAERVGLVDMSSGTPRLPRDSRSELGRLANKQEHYDARAYFQAIESLQQVIAFLSGGWWEVIVSDAVERSGLFRDIRWSATAGERGGADMEEDILALEGVQVVCVSCKRGGARSRLLPQLEELNARARSIGGHFTRRFLAIFKPLSGVARNNVQRRAKEIDVSILGPQDIFRRGAFARARP